jgi:hypothetical protein
VKQEFVLFCANWDQRAVKKVIADEKMARIIFYFKSKRGRISNTVKLV